MADPALMPLGVTVDVVDWLPSGARSGLVRVRGRRPHGPDWRLPALVLGDPAGGERRFDSLPDPRAERDPSGWRGAYVVDVALATAAAGWRLEWPGGARTALAAPAVAQAPGPPDPEPEPPGGEVVDETVMAQRRARRAEAAEQAQARIAKEALRAVEVLELRAGEVEERLERAQAERDALRERLEAVAREAPGPAADPAPAEAVGAVAAAPPQPAPEAVAALDAELRALKAELARRDADAPPGAGAAEPAPAREAERRAARLREALTATVGTVAELRLQLHEVQVARRTRELEWSAGAVRLSVLEREHGELQAALAAARAELDAARAVAAEAATAVEAARAAVAAAEAAGEDARAALAGREAELAAARARSAALEAELADVRARAEAAAEEAAEGARIVAVAEALVREGEREEAWTARLAEAERATALAEGRLAHLEASLEEAETARELAEARAHAADAARRAAAVAHVAAPPRTPEPVDDAVTLPPARRFARSPAAPEAVPVAAGADPFAAAAERLRRLAPAPPAADVAAPPASPAADVAPPPASPAADLAGPPAPPCDDIAPPPPAAPPVPDDVAAAAAEQVRAAAERAATGDEAERDRVVADLAAAAQTLRACTADTSPEEAAALPERPLRAALVELAREDAPAAARLLVSLLPAQHLLLGAPADHDLTLRELGTFAVASTPDATSVTTIDHPRPRRAGGVHLRADAQSLAQLLAGEEVRVRRFSGPVRLSGPGRRAFDPDRLRAPDVALGDAIRAGAVPEPALALRCLALAVPPAWTGGHDFALALDVDGTGARLVVRDGERPAWDAEPAPADTRVRLSRAAYAALLAGEPDGRAWDVDGDPRPARVVASWAGRLLGPRP